MSAHMHRCIYTPILCTGVAKCFNMQVVEAVVQAVESLQSECASSVATNDEPIFLITESSLRDVVTRHWLQQSMHTQIGSFPLPEQQPQQPTCFKTLRVMSTTVTERPRIILGKLHTSL